MRKTISRQGPIFTNHQILLTLEIDASRESISTLIPRLEGVSVKKGLQPDLSSH